MKKFFTGVQHIAVKAPGYEAYLKAFDFYKDILGFDLIRQWGEGDSSYAMLDIGGVLIELSADGAGLDSDGPVHHFALALEDVDGAIAYMRENGVEVFMEPKDIVIQSDPVYPARIAFIIGPAGEKIEFFHVK